MSISVSGISSMKGRIWLLMTIPVIVLVSCAGSDSELTATPENTVPTTIPTASSSPTTSSPTVVPTRLPGPGGDSIVLTPTVAPTASVNATPTSAPLDPTPGVPNVDPTSTPVLQTATPVPTPTPTPPVPQTQTPTPTVLPGPTATPAPTSTSTATPTITPTPTPTRIPTSTPIPDPPTPTPIPTPDPRFGVISGGPLTSYRLGQLGVEWYIDYSPDPSTAPNGTKKLPFISVKPGKDRLTPTEIATFTSAAPGSPWYIGGEPNVPQQDGITPEAYAVEFDYYATEIRASDPTAKIMGPSILNWDFTCTGCTGFQSGESWMRQFVDTYIFTHAGEVPPVDIWAIDAYPLTWDVLPMTNWQIVTDQLAGFRQYLRDEVPGHADTPIWLTEVASHWGFNGFRIVDGKLTIPEGQTYENSFLWDEEISYMDGIIGWLKVNAAAQNIERWFFYEDWADISKTAAGGYAGIQFFESGDDGAALNQLGQVYRDHALGLR